MIDIQDIMSNTTFYLSEATEGYMSDRESLLDELVVIKKIEKRVLDEKEKKAYETARKDILKRIEELEYNYAESVNLLLLQISDYCKEITAIKPHIFLRDLLHDIYGDKNTTETKSPHEKPIEKKALNNKKTSSAAKTVQTQKKKQPDKDTKRIKKEYKKLTKEEKEEIILRYSNGGITVKTLVKEYNSSNGVISKLIKGITPKNKNK